MVMVASFLSPFTRGTFVQRTNSYGVIPVAHLRRKQTHMVSFPDLSHQYFLSLPVLLLLSLWVTDQQEVHKMQGSDKDNKINNYALETVLITSSYGERYPNCAL